MLLYNVFPLAIGVMSILAVYASNPENTLQMALHTDFPDPGFVRAANGDWYAFGTNGNGKRIQVARSSNFENWTLLDIEALTSLSPWETDANHWAPDVRRRNDGKYVMYYSAEAKSGNGHHCISVAVSQNMDPTGPYIPLSQPFACPLDQGGAIDPSGFLDRDGRRYVVYKVDGNSIGNGGDCNNGIPPLKSTPIMLQEVTEDGFTQVGPPVQILDRDASDGPLVEAPNLILHGDTYFLFYSTHCFTDPTYDVRYATSKLITGPYVKPTASWIGGGIYGGVNLTSPGGATVSVSGDKILFHGSCDVGRCMYEARIGIAGDVVTLDA